MMEFSSIKLIWSFCVLVHIATVTVRGVILTIGVPKYIIRKCCASDEYYNLQIQQCVKEGDLRSFETLVQNRLIKGTDLKSMVIVTGRLLNCPETEECFETNEIVNDKTHTLLPNGLVFENFFGVTYDLRNYCLENVGSNNQNVSLAIAFCLPETNIIPKCCPKNHYFDAKTFECVAYPQNDISEELLSTFFYFKNEIFLQYQYELECATAFPVKINFINDAYIDECNNVCLRGSNQCYSMRKFCLDSVFTDRLEPSAYLCADNVTKVCCKDERFEKNEIECTCGPMDMHQ